MMFDSSSYGRKSDIVRVTRFALSLETFNTSMNKKSEIASRTRQEPDHLLNDYRSCISCNTTTCRPTCYTLLVLSAEYDSLDTVHIFLQLRLDFVPFWLYVYNSRRGELRNFRPFSQCIDHGMHSQERFSQQLCRVVNLLSGESGAMS